MQLPGLFENLEFDNLQKIFSCFIGFLSVIILIYSSAYIKTRRIVYYSFFILAVICSFGIVLSGTLMYYYVFWELLTLCIFFLIIYRAEQEHFRAGMLYLAMNLSGGFLVLFSFVLTEERPGSFAIGFPFLFLLGHLVKAGAFPFQAWLPVAHPAVPSPISALLSGMTIKLSVYGLIRWFLPYLAGPGSAPYRHVLIISAVISIFWGAVSALKQKEIKKLLAYSSISQMGYIFLGIGLGSKQGLEAGLFYALNHGIIKALFFLSAGAVIFSTGKKELGRTGDLYRAMPGTFLLALVGVMSISGLPPFSGFFSKNFLSTAAGNSSFINTVIFLAGICTTAAAIKFIHYVFLIPPVSPQAQAITSPVPKRFLFPMLALALACLFPGIYSFFQSDFFQVPVSWSMPEVLKAFAVLVTGFIFYFFAGKTKWFKSLTFLPPAVRVYGDIARQGSKICAGFRKIHNRPVSVHQFWVLLFLSLITVFSLALYKGGLF